MFRITHIVPEMGGFDLGFGITFFTMREAN